MDDTSDSIYVTYLFVIYRSRNTRKHKKLLRDIEYGFF